MAHVLPHVPPPHLPHHQVKPNQMSPNKTAQAHSSNPSGSTPAFQHLVERASHRAGPEKAADPVRTLKAKSLEAGPEKVKEPKKHEKHEVRSDANELTALAVVVPVAKVDNTTKTSKAAESESASPASDRNRPQKSERRPAADATGPSANFVTEQLRPQNPVTKSDRTDEKPKVFVVDRRSDKEKERLKTHSAEAAASTPVNASVEVQRANKAADPSTGPQIAKVEFQLASQKSKDSFDLKPGSQTVSPRDAASFQAYLVEKGYGQLVDQARIVLKDQNAGEIRMTLYPESLGKVKVNLNLSDNSLAGQIFVENQTVKEVFQSNMDGLLQAFRDGGWNDLSLQVSVGGEGGAGTPSHREQTAPQARDYERQVSQTTVVEGRTDRIGAWNDRQVNLTA